MNQILLEYQRVPPTTWVYLSSLLTIALFFKFSRFFSVRNLDLVGLILLAPGLLLVVNYDSYTHPSIATTPLPADQIGFIWLFAMGGFFLVRLLLDPSMIRRPLLEPNMSVGGIAFLGASLLIFLMANVLTSTMTADDLEGSKQAEQLGARQEVAIEQDSFAQHGPGYPLLFLVPHLSTKTIIGEESGLDRGQGVEEGSDGEMIHLATARTVAILSHLAIVIGMVAVGYWHFENMKAGLAAAALYLLLPYTAQLTGRIYHVLPAALLTWSIVAYRRPLVAGLLVGMATGVIYYPAFLLPLWLGFYWQRGSLRFSLGVLAAIAVLVGTLAFTSTDLTMFLAQVKQMFGWRVPVMTPGGFWQFVDDPVYRIPVLAAFVALAGSLAIWPAQKNLGTLMSCSAAVMLATQFWHAYGGGLYMAWYMPLLLLTVFRPNLEDRVALSVLAEGWFPRRRVPRPGIERAA